VLRACPQPRAVSNVTSVYFHHIVRFSKRVQARVSLLQPAAPASTDATSHELAGAIWMALAVAAACYSSPDFQRYEMPKVCRSAAELCALPAIRCPIQSGSHQSKTLIPPSAVLPCRTDDTAPRSCSRRGSRTRHLMPRTDDRSRPQQRPTALSKSTALVRRLLHGGVRRGCPALLAMHHSAVPWLSPSSCFLSRADC
jgi:hypothetical protein